MTPSMQPSNTFKSSFARASLLLLLLSAAGFGNGDENPQIASMTCDLCDVNQTGGNTDTNQGNYRPDTLANNTQRNNNNDPNNAFDHCSSADLSSEPDSDDDGVIDICDNCLDEVNPDQTDSDHDGLGNVCDIDDDQDGISDELDNCPLVFHPDQDDTDADGIGNACDPCPRGEDSVDSDADGLSDCVDLCPSLSDSNNNDSDGDGVGDVCDNCVDSPNFSQWDRDGNGVGETCDDPPNQFEIEEATVTSIQRSIAAGRATCEEIVESYLDRIHRHDLDISDSPPINAMVSINPNVREQAMELDSHYEANGAFVGSLHCAPVILKDLYASKDTPVSSGSYALVGTFPRNDSFAVGRMRDAGAIILGTTAMDEFSKGVYSHSSRTGRTGNPYDTNFNPGGSSSGSGAGVGGNFAIGGTGTDNCGSLILPGSYNGLVSMRPSVGLVSLRGVFPSNALDAVAGPMARTVTDFALMLDQMAGEDPEDFRTVDSEANRPSSYSQFLNADGLKGKRIGILRSLGDNANEHARYTWAGGSAFTMGIFNRVLREMEAQGATIVDNVILSQLNIDRAGGFGWADDLNTFFADVNGPIQNFIEMCDTGGYSGWVWSSAQQCIDDFNWSLVNGDINGQRYLLAKQRYDANRRSTEQIMDELDLDVLMYPSDAWGAPRVTSDKSNCVINSVSQMPSLTFVVGYSATPRPLPLGMAIQARKWDEPTLIEIAYAYEQATGHRMPPQLSSVAGDTSIAPLDIDNFNDMKDKIGQYSYERVLRDQDRWNMTANAITRIVEDVLEEFNQDFLLDQ